MFNGDIYSVAAQPNGRVLAGGYFTQVNGVVRNFVVRLNSDGSLDMTFNPGVGTPTIKGLSLQTADGKTIIGGDFQTAGGTLAPALARLRPDGSRDLSFNTNLSPGDDVLALGVTGGDVLSAGKFAGITRSRPALTRAALQPDAASRVSASIIRVGSGGVRQNRPAATLVRGGLAEVSGQFNPDAGVDGATKADIFTLVIQAGGKILVGGEYERLNPEDGDNVRPNLGRLTASGDFDSTFSATANAAVRALAVQADGKVLAGGDFTQVSSASGSASRSFVSRFLADGSIDTAFNPSSGPNGPVYVVKALTGGKVLIGGRFNAVQGQPRGGVARLNADGSLDAGFVSSPLTAASGAADPPLIATLSVQSDGKVVVGGSFDKVGDLRRPNVARLLASGVPDPSYSTGSGPNAMVRVLDLQEDGRAVLGGDFQVVDTFERTGAARLLTDLAFTSAPPESQAATLGQSFTLSAPAEGAGTLAYQWLKDGQMIDGATAATYTIASVSAASAGSYTCRVTGTAGTITTVPSQVRVRRAARAINVSTRTRVESGDNVMIGGFVIAGTGTKRVLIKGLGPSLAASVPGTLANPTLQVVNANGQTLAGDAQGQPVVVLPPNPPVSNDNWRDTQQALIQATNQAPTNDLEAAVVLDLPAGGYTAIVRGAGGAQGVGLVEVYDLQPEATNARLINLSTRSRVQTGDNVMIGGFVVQGEPDQRRRVLVRVLGPSLAVAGVPNLLANPRVDIFNGGAVIGYNDDWQATTAFGSTPADIRAVNLAPNDSRESAVILSLAPGGYTAIVRGADGGSGNAIIEAYELPDLP